MILVLSTSSPQTSVAWFKPDGTSAWSGRRMASRNASGAALALLEEGGIGLERAMLLVADVGPGSFTGTRVGVVLAKTFGWLYGVPCAGVSAFDLIAPDGEALVPNRRGEWFHRRPGAGVEIVTLVPAGVPGSRTDGDETYPDAERAGPLLGRLEQISAQELEPQYLVEPSISLPKTPYGGTLGRA